MALRVQIEIDGCGLWTHEWWCRRWMTLLALIGGEAAYRGTSWSWESMVGGGLDGGDGSMDH